MIDLSTAPLSYPGKKILFIRLSSLGDVILSSSALSALADERYVVAHWLTSREYSSLLSGHPKIARLWVFDRKEGLRGWLRLCRELRAARFDEVIDLHSSLRTRIARTYFRLNWILDGGMVSWKTIPRDRWRLYGLYLFKGLWPKSLAPRKLVERSGRIAGGTGVERPSLIHLLPEAGVQKDFLRQQGLVPQNYFCIMPSSRWLSKAWPVENFVRIASSLRAQPVVLGMDSDEPSRKLIEALKQNGTSHVSGVGRWDLRQTAVVLANSLGCLGNDTGLAHLSEALGVPVTTIFGPTVPEMGFGPWNTESASIGALLWCRPCGKDGRACFRLANPQLCLTSLTPEKVLERIPSVWR